MAFDASGTFTRLRGNDSWKGDATAGTKIKSDLHDNNDNDIANGLSETLTKTGKSLPVVDIPWGGFKITNLGNPTQPGDAANKTYVDTLPGWPKSKNIEGADLDGRLNFTAPSGVNGITWTYADVSWIARHSVASKYGNRLAMNSGVAPNTTGDPVGDVFFIDDAGRINNTGGTLSQNLSYDGAAWRTISPGTGTYIAYSSGSVRFASNDTATITNPYAVATMREYFTVSNSAGTASMVLRKSASGKYNHIWGYTGTEARWRIDLGNATAESSTRGGSDLYIYSYDNAGAAPMAELSISRSTHAASMGGDLTLAGNLIAEGRRCRSGTTGGYGGNYHNFQWSGGFVYAYIDATLIGAIMWQSDYRMKRDIQPLPSMWEKIKSLNPVSYRHQNWGIVQDVDDKERWGFTAHELQDELIETAATGHKDEDNVIQQPNPWVVIAALTKALQEAMQRIEVLEAAA